MFQGHLIRKARPNFGFLLARVFSSTTVVSNSAMGLIQRAEEHARAQRLAMVDTDGRVHSYADLLRDSASVSRALRAASGGDADLGEKTVAFLCPSDSTYAHVQWGVWRAGGVAVPLSPKHPKDELDYFLSDCGAALVVGHSKYESLLRPVTEAQGKAYVDYDALVSGSGLEGDDNNDDAPIEACDLPSRASHIIYTSGTTGRPKGVVTTHAALEAQVGDLCSSWGWTTEDRILHFLPLHHVHGIVNKLSCALSSGATVEFTGGFDAAKVWRRLAAQESAAGAATGLAPTTVFMAVPTIYAKLIELHDEGGLTEEEKAAGAEAMRKLRLMVSGSAALPMSVLERWREITGHTLLERYGMTEFGMGLSNPLDMSKRRAGYVGAPLPSVEAKIVKTSSDDDEDEEGGDEFDERECGAGEAGELRIRGANVFREYLNRPEATAAE